MIDLDLLRLAVFAAVLGLMLGLEGLVPRREAGPRRGRRRLNNLALAATGSALVRLLPMVLPVAAAEAAAARGFGLFPALGLTGPAAVVLCLVLLDAALYFQHRLSHAWRPFWMLHRTHHADTDLDATTGVRFHPLEILASAAIKSGLAFALGLPPAGVAAFEAVLNSCAVFNHANVALPGRLDAVLRPVLVTPDMHRVHHSVHMDENGKNFGFCLACWDRIFGSYKPQPRDGHQTMRLGLNILRDERHKTLPGLLAIPFVRQGPSPRP